jgi:hypothetical protein
MSAQGTALALMLALGIGAPASAQERNEATRNLGRYLELRPARYSIFEVSPEGHILLYFPLGVEGWYMGHHINAGELEYNQANEQVRLAGGVTIELGSYEITCETALLDGLAGTASVPGELSGTDSQRGIFFEAASAAATFPPGINNLDNVAVTDVSLTLQGKVRATDSEGHFIRSSGLLLTAGLLKTQGDFELLLEEPADDEQDRVLAAADDSPVSVLDSYADVELWPMLIRGAEASGELHDEGGFGLLTLTRPTVSSPGIWLSAERATVNLSGLESGDGAVEPVTQRLLDAAVPRLTLDGSPVRLSVPRSAGPESELQASVVRLSEFEAESQYWELSGDVTLLTPFGNLFAGSLGLRRRGDRSLLELPDGISLDFDLAALAPALGFELSLPGSV